MKKMALICMAVLALGLVVLFIGFSGDEPLEPAVVEVMSFRPPEAAPEDNAYVGLSGLGGLEDGDVVTAGKKYLASEAEPPSDSEPDPPLDYSYENPCLKRGEENCLDQILADEAIISAAFEKNSEFIERYQTIQNMPSYINTSGFYDRSPNYRTLLIVSQLVNAKALLDIKRGDLSGGLDSLENDLNFYKRIARSDYIHLIDLNVAVSQVQRCEVLLSRIIEDGRIDISGSEECFRKMLDLDFNVGRIMAAVLEEEKRLVLQMLHSLPETCGNDSSGEEPGYWVSLNDKLEDSLLKLNMTMNRLSAQYDEEISQIQATPMLNFPNYYRLRMASHEFEDDSGIKPNLAFKNLYEIYGLFFFKNYFGEYLLNIAQPHGFKYAGSLTDAVVYSHLVRAQLELRLMADRPEDVSEALAGLGPETRNPYTGQPFEWDKDANVLRAKMADPRAPATVGLEFR